MPFYNPGLLPIADGQLIIGKTGGAAKRATLTAGANVTITDAANAITIASTGGGGGGALTELGAVVTSASVTSVTFSAIPNLYNDLILVGQVRSQRAAISDTAIIRFNGDATANYVFQRVTGANLTASAGVQTPVSNVQIATVAAASLTANIAGVFECIIPNYSSTIFHKNTISHGGYFDGTTNGDASLRVGKWANTAVINSMVISLIVGSAFVDGSTLLLYGRG